MKVFETSTVLTSYLPIHTDALMIKAEEYQKFPWKNAEDRQTDGQRERKKDRQRDRLLLSKGLGIMPKKTASKKKLFLFVEAQRGKAENDWRIFA